MPGEGLPTRQEVADTSISQDNWSFHGVCRGYVFRNCEISFTDMHYTGFIDCRFVGCRIEHVDFGECTFKSCEFVECQITSTSFANSIFNDCRFLKDFRAHSSLATDHDHTPGLESCDFSYCMFSDNDTHTVGLFYGLPISNTSLERSHFSNCRISGCDVVSCNFSESTFECSVVEDINLRDCNCRGLAFRDSTLRNFKLNLQKFVTIFGVLAAVDGQRGVVSFRDGTETSRIYLCSNSSWKVEIVPYLRRLQVDFLANSRVFEYVHTSLIVEELVHEATRGEEDGRSGENQLALALNQFYQQAQHHAGNLKSTYLLLKLVEFQKLKSVALLRKLAGIASIAVLNESMRSHLCAEVREAVRQLACDMPSGHFLLSLTFAEGGNIGAVQERFGKIVQQFDVHDYLILHYKTGSITVVSKILSPRSMMAILMFMFVLGVRMEYKIVGGESHFSLAYSIAGSFNFRNSETELEVTLPDLLLRHEPADVELRRALDEEVEQVVQSALELPDLGIEAAGIEEAPATSIREVRSVLEPALPVGSVESGLPRGHAKIPGPYGPR